MEMEGDKMRIVNKISNRTIGETAIIMQYVAQQQLSYYIYPIYIVSHRISQCNETEKKKHRRKRCRRKKIAYGAVLIEISNFITLIAIDLIKKNI